MTSKIVEERQLGRDRISDVPPHFIEISNLILTRPEYVGDADKRDELGAALQDLIGIRQAKLLDGVKGSIDIGTTSIDVLEI